MLQHILQVSLWLNLDNKAMILALCTLLCMSTEIVWHCLIYKLNCTSAQGCLSGAMTITDANAKNAFSLINMILKLCMHYCVLTLVYQ